MINLTKNGEIFRSDTDKADTFNEYFSNAAKNLNIPRENSMLNTDIDASFADDNTLCSCLSHMISVLGKL